MTMDRVAVNGTEIPSAVIDAEIQYHPAKKASGARIEATRALVIREILLQEARRLGLKPLAAADGEVCSESEDEALIGELLKTKVDLPEPSEDACRAYYEGHPERFLSPDLFEPAHILLSASPADESAYTEAVRRAEAIIETVLAHPDKFSEIARAQSDCSSAADGGGLGQVTRGQTAPEFETFLVVLEEDQICPVPVKSRYGVHVLRLNRKVEGRKLPFEAVHNKITAYLVETDWRRNVHVFINDLVAAAELEGIDDKVMPSSSYGRPNSSSGI
jgi:peptidyl-prolyl cis-trans isomerase C